MFDRRWTKMLLIFFSLYFLAVFMLPEEAFARIGGGRSFGSRGSRTYTAPRSTPLPSTARSSQAAQPSSNSTDPAVAQPTAGGFWRSLAGGVAGGLIGGMLFRSLGFAGNGFGGGGIGLMDIILIGGILYLIYRFIRKRKETAESAGDYQRGTMGTADPSSSSLFQTGALDEGERGIGYVRQMDPSFDEQKFKDQCMDIFFRIQGAWASRDMSSVSDILTSEMYDILQGEAEKMKTEKKINKLDNIAVRSVDITEVWQESGQDYITMKFFANLLDSTVDETTGQLLSGSRTDPIKFVEYWTFTRPVGAGAWQLSAISQAE